MIVTNTSNASKMPKQTNVFLIINLGCEMLYVIDQRLKAQCITLDKSAQGKYVLHGKAKELLCNLLNRLGKKITKRILKRTNI